MLRIVEAFSGIGSQVQALNNIKLETEVAATIEWDINAIYAYDIIHNGVQDLSNFPNYKKPDAIKKLLKFGVSTDGKNLANEMMLRTLSADSLRRFLYAIERTKNLVNITNVTASDLPTKIDLLTYSFPCQDLSVCGSWHGNMTGINKDVNNRSGMLWEVERILKEYVETEKKLPKFLLMENVRNILSRLHHNNFNDWKQTLEDMGYINQVYTLNSINFGIPQQRNRTFMLSVHCNDILKKAMLETYFKKNDLAKLNPREIKPLSEFLRTDYSIPDYFLEAEESNPYYTPSRKRIHEENEIIFNGYAYAESIKTITTKQDRNPNSGLITYKSKTLGKAPYRNLTPRECFLLMGFDEDAFDRLMTFNIETRKGQKLYSREKTIKLAGNSIVVNVLEEIFKQVAYIKSEILKAI
ncbi:MAG: DNA (cytosine-5-)-methyltransferase [Dehalococcoides mccartyi]|uniref:DNA (cytosine-5-)-methyltransferase n=1 Tax=Dehalococcoides mccartyi TaxID=61435 RepID=UPI0030F815A1